MRSLLVSVILTISLAGSALAAEEYIDLYPCMDPCCTFSSICVDMECCGMCCETHPLTVQFLDADGSVLGSTVIEEDWCGGCYDQHFAELDNTVNSADVCSIRLITEFDDCCMADWAAIKVLCEDPCDCGDWKMAWKGDLMCWMPMPEPEEIAVAPEPPMPETERPALAPEPKPEPQRPVYREPEPEPEPEPEKEVIHVIGNG